MADSKSQNQQLQPWWRYFLPLVDHFDELVQQIQGGDTILAASDRSYLEDRQALARWALYVPGVEIDNDEGRTILEIKVLFRGTILVDSRLDLNSTYRAESVGVFTVTIFLHFI